MLASNAESIDELAYPVIASPKLDGIRCLMIGGQVLSRSLKPIRNDHIRETLSKILPEGADGEIMVGSTFQDVSSGVMSRRGEPEFVYWMFDLAPGGADAPGYTDRLLAMTEWGKAHADETRVVVVPTETIHSAEQLREYEQRMIDAGYEGVMVRAPGGPYKCGRATAKQGWLLKVKRFEDSEAEVLGLDEQMQNINEATKNELGRTQRSSAKAGKIGKSTLGAFRVRDVHSGIEFSVGTGLTDAQRQEIWDNRAAYMGRIVKYKFQPHGVKEKPRLPIWLGFRSTDDMSGAAA